MEELLHYVWLHRLFPSRPLQTTGGMPVEVIDPGLPNADAGPDFFNAKLRLGGTLWVGNVELHLRSSDWYRHGHQHDPAYDNVVLHVVERADCDVARRDGCVLPQLELSCPDEVRARYEGLCRRLPEPPCAGVVAAMPRIEVSAWMSALQVERLAQRTAEIDRRLDRHDRRWDDAFFVSLARNFGFGLNGDVFEAWADRLPFRALGHLRDQLFQVEAICFGMAGMLAGTDAACPPTDDYQTRLRREFAYQCRKWDLPQPLDASRWRMARIRPGSFPQVRIAQLAWLYAERPTLFSQVVGAASADEVRPLLRARTSDYWDCHYAFGRPSPCRPKTVGSKALGLLLVNTVIPFLYAYGRHKADDALCERALQLMDALPPEDNRIVRLWSRAGVQVRSAADTQALVQLQRAYCDRRDCLRCRFGYAYLRGRKG